MALGDHLLDEEAADREIDRTNHDEASAGLAMKEAGLWQCFQRTCRATWPSASVVISPCAWDSAASTIVRSANTPPTRRSRSVRSFWS